jgi:hypothetical protein
MRPGEIIALKKSDLNSESLTVKRRIYRGKIDTQKPKTATAPSPYPKV